MVQSYPVMELNKGNQYTHRLEIELYVMRIKILTVLNGVSGNGLGKGTAGAFGACGATPATFQGG